MNYEALANSMENVNFISDKNTFIIESQSKTLFYKIKIYI